MLRARTDFALALNQVCAERGIEPEVVLQSLQTALLAALKRDLQLEDDDLSAYEVKIDPETGAVSFFKDGKNVTPPGFGRIAAQVAKQVILQKVREAEKQAIIDEYQTKIGTITNGMVLRFDGPNVIVDIGRGQGVMPPASQIPNEYYRLNQRLAVYLQEIRDTYKGKVIIVSRSHPQLVALLFKREVPELASGAVEIVAVAREAGHRTKIAVKSLQDGVDPVGSCVGQKGVRVQAVINELNGEKIDIIEYSDDPVAFIKAALAPAEGLEVTIDDKKKRALVTVPEDQLSLAIGKGGQNARLAARLTGYKIDIQGATNDKPSLSTSGNETFEIDQLGLSTRLRNLLLDQGYQTVASLQDNLDKLSDLEDIDQNDLQEINKALLRYQKQLQKIAEEEVKAQRALANQNKNK